MKLIPTVIEISKHKSALISTMTHKMSHNNEEDKKDVSDVFEQFANSTSMHGVPHIINARSMMGRFIWSMVCIWAFGMFLWQCGGLLERFFSYPKKVNMEIVQSPIPFPAVTVCNTDFMDIEVANHVERFFTDDNTTHPPFNLSVSPLVENFARNYVKFSDDIALMMFQYTRGLDIVHESKIEDMEFLLSLNTRYSLLANLGFNMSDTGSVKLPYFIASCQFMNKKCRANSSFSQYFDPYYFKCFTFEPEQILDNRSTRLQGVEYGLTLLLSSLASAGEVTKVDYAVGMQEVHLALASERGARVVVHTPGTRPHPTADGYDIPTGYSVTMGVRARQNVRISQPHGNCTQIKDQPLKVDQTMHGHNQFRYTLIDCQNECIQKMIMDRCGCMDNRIGLVENPLNVPFCFKLANFPDNCPAFADADCEKALRKLKLRIECRNMVHEIMTRKNPDAMRECNCYPPCEDTHYDVSYSLSTLPKESPAHSSFFKELDSYLDSLPQNRKDLLEYKLGADYNKVIKKNMIRLTVHISDSNIIKTIESPDYEPIRLVSDIGGQLGLWIGISVVTLFETFKLVVDIMGFLMGKNCKTPKLKIPPKEMANRVKVHSNGYNGFVGGNLVNDDEEQEMHRLTTV